MGRVERDGGWLIEYIFSIPYLAALRLKIIYAFQANLIYATTFNGSVALRCRKKTYCFLK